MLGWGSFAVRETSNPAVDTAAFPRLVAKAFLVVAAKIQEAPFVLGIGCALRRSCNGSKQEHNR